jgi:hypothetical protein
MAALVCQMQQLVPAADDIYRILASDMFLA